VASDKRPTVNADATVAALGVAVVGVGAQMAAYYLSRATLGPGRPICIAGDLSGEQLRMMAWVLAAVRAITVAVPGILEVPSLDHFAALCNSASIILLYTLHLQDRLSAVERVLLFALLIPAEVIVRLASGSLANLMLLFLLLTLVRWVVSRRVAWLMIGLAALTLVVFQPIKGEYRRQVWGNPQAANMGYLERSSLMMGLAADYWLRGNSSQSADVAELVRSRLNQLAILATIVEDTPSRVPYWGGESYYDGIYFFIPRIVWPDKPSLTIGNTFGHHYGLLAPQDQDTSLNLPWITEFYANFGYPGVIVGMALVGILFAAIERRFGHPGNARIDAAIALAATFVLVYPESSLALMWSGLFLATVTLVLITRIIRGVRIG
jgi:hypothetical protein